MPSPAEIAREARQVAAAIEIMASKEVGSAWATAMMNESAMLTGKGSRTEINEAHEKFAEAVRADLARYQP